MRLTVGPRVRLLDAARMTFDGMEATFVLPHDLGGDLVELRLRRRLGSAFSAYSPVAGAVLPGTAMVSAVASATGLNQTVWRSDLALLNVRDITQQVGLVMSDGSTGTVTVPAKGQLVLDDVVASIGTGGAGALSVLADGSLVVASRTYNLGAEGTFGQPFAGVRAVAALPLAEPVELIGTVESAAFRTNLGLVSAGDQAATVLVTLR
ncbi:MAG: hypothetical protein GY838_15850, partial [bacterium]|nr:hypothetical protein [bacterium]